MTKLFGLVKIKSDLTIHSLERSLFNFATTYNIWFLLLSYLSFFDLFTVRLADKEIFKLVQANERYKNLIWISKNIVLSKMVEHYKRKTRYVGVQT